MSHICLMLENIIRGKLCRMSGNLIALMEELCATLQKSGLLSLYVSGQEIQTRFHSMTVGELAS